jgi:putative thioredoxin
MAYEVTDFQAEVIDASHQQPVVVDFWAPWCGPCQFLGPVIEKLAGEAAGKWQLAKVNSDQFQEQAQRYRVKSIPAVKLFVNGQVVAEFAGAQPEPYIRRWLDQHLPSENDKQVQRAANLARSGREPEAVALLEKVLAGEPGNAHAALELGCIVVFTDPVRAVGLFRTAEHDGALYHFANSLFNLAELLVLAQDPSRLEDHPVKETFLAALAALARQDFGPALEQFIDVIQRHKAYQDKSAEKACVAIFHYLGEQHETVKQYRRQFSMALY